MAVRAKLLLTAVFYVSSKHFIIFHKFHQIDMLDTISVLQYIIVGHKDNKNTS